jgi:hypothetical protein
VSSDGALRLPAPSAIVSDIAQRLDANGFVCLDGAVSLDWVARAQEYVRQSLCRNGRKYFSIIRPSNLAGSPFDELVRNPATADLLEGLARIGCPRATFDREVYNVLRVVAGPAGTDGSYEFHYDATVVTMLVPILLPARGPLDSGGLLTFSNRRPYRSSVLVNVAEKVMVQNRWGRRRFARTAHADLSAHLQVMEPGNLYLFWGYRTLHGNLPCAPEAVRATLLLHHGDPHGSSPLLRAIRAVRKAAVDRRRERA